MPVTPFGRTVDAVLLKHATGASGARTPVNKWTVLRELAAARSIFGISDRDLTVLQAIIGFHKETELDGRACIVHPSNQSICERLNGMPNSTMRRHVANLVQAGLLIRRDSPNGKRYVRRSAGERTAFGFDLAPLALRYDEIHTAANRVRAAEVEMKALRETVGLMRRDLAGLAGLGQQQDGAEYWDRHIDLARLAARQLRRKLGIEELQALQEDLANALDDIRSLLCPQETSNPSTSTAENEHHIQNSKKDSYESEPGETRDQADPKLSLGLVLSHCKEMGNLTSEPIRHWTDFTSAAAKLAPMMGIPANVWHSAEEAMGKKAAAVAIAAMLERFSEIRSPSAYLRHLTNKARANSFSCVPMVHALSRRV